MAAPDSASRATKGVSRTSDRLASRAQRSALRRQAMPGGGEVFTGDLASRALKSLGARAMTMDRSIIVSDEFDASRPEDQALYAHEQYHVEHSGGQGSNEHRDAEEVAARSVERMVLHRAAGGMESHEASHAVPGTDNHGASGPSQGKGKKQEKESNAQRGYDALIAQGLRHPDIIDRLAQEVITVIDHQRDTRYERFGDKKGFL